ncbi:MAG: cytochrome c [Deltaproteobacteria bacterium]|nr:cytochrome c [Deltaproteobacteria bacterium]
MIAGVSSSCVSPAPPPVVEVLPQGPDSLTIHTGEAWFQSRARWLGISPEEARRRDSELDTQRPPDPDFWDPQLSVEVASLWSALCNECHGGRRRISEARFIPPPAPGWGRGEGFFFGSKKPREREFRVVFEGGKSIIAEKSKMPSWGGRLSREQIWGLVHYVEFYSMSVEGHFPPGLYPEASDRMGATNE